MPSRLRLHAAPATFVSLAVILALAAAGLVAVSSTSRARSRPSRTRGSADAAKQLHCGDTITADATLHHDLRPFLSAISMSTKSGTWAID